MKDIMKFQTHPQPTQPHTHTHAVRAHKAHTEWNRYTECEREGGGVEQGEVDMRLLVWHSGRKTALFWTKEKILHT